MAKEMKRGRGRPPTGATPVTVRMLPNELSRVDRWIAKQPRPKPTRPKAIKQLVDMGLKSKVN